MRCSTSTAKVDVEDSGNHATVAWDGGTITLLNVDHALLTEADFEFDLPDSLTGTNGSYFTGDRGNNSRLRGGDGNDTIDGGGGNDRITGGNGNDILDGGADNDRLTGGEGIDVLQGGAGNDTLTSGDTDSAFRGPGDIMSGRVGR